MARWEGDTGGPERMEIDYKSLKNMCNIQGTGEECACVLGIDYDTLDRRLKQDGHGGFTEYFKKNSGGGKMSLRRRQFKMAEEGNAALAIWLGKQWLGQKEPKDITTVNVQGGTDNKWTIEFMNASPTSK